MLCGFPALHHGLLRIGENLYVSRGGSGSLQNLLKYHFKGIFVPLLASRDEPSMTTSPRLVYAAERSSLLPYSFVEPILS